MRRCTNDECYIDRHGVPHGDWRVIIGRKLAEWNAERDKIEDHKSELNFD